MPQGKIKKGFFFYFGLFVLLVVAIFLIILVILMFNPGKTILWFKYFTAGNTYEVTTTTDEGEQPIDLSSTSNITNIEVECSYADVRIQKSNEVRKDCIVIENNAKGFATSSQATDFSYNVIIKEGNTLSITVVEPVGFIYLSNDITITINIFFNEDHGTASGDFSNIGFNVITTSGNIDIGGNTYLNQTITPRSITARTTSGNIMLRSSANILNTQSINFTTDNGGMITTGNNVIYNNQQASGIVLNNGSINLRTSNGTIDFDVIKINNSGTLNVENYRGNVVLDNVEVDNFTINSYEGNYLIGKVVCDEFSFTPSEDRVHSPNIQIEELTGNLVISSSTNNANPDLTIGKLTGNADILNVNGSININSISGGRVYAQIQNGQLNLTYASQTSKHNEEDYLRANGNASITVNFEGAFKNDLRMITGSGNININFTNNAGFTANSFVNDGENYGRPETGIVPELLSNDKISTNIGNIEKNPLLVKDNSGNSDSVINIYTNSNVTFTLR